MSWLSLIIIPALALLAAWYLFPAEIGRALISVERQRNGVHSRNLYINGSTWHYLEAGHGSPLLALHGIAADADHWTRLAGILRNHYHIYAPDLPGFGFTDAPQNGDYTLEAQVSNLHDFVSAAGLDSFVLAGSSMGGQIAAAYAVRYPEHVSSLCLLAPGGVMGASFSPVMKAVVREAQNPLLVRNHADFKHLISLCFYTSPSIPKPVIRWVLARTKKLENNTRAAFDAIRFYSNSLESFAGQISQPCLLLWGKNDQVLDVSGARILASIIPRIKLVVIDNMGHLPMLENPPECARLILQFIDGLDREVNN